MRSAVLMVAVALIAGCGLLEPDERAEPAAPAARLPYDAAAPLYGRAADFATRLPAAGSCPTEDERRSDLLIQLHTELMVTRLTCGAGGVANMAYATFTERHQARLRTAQATLEGLLGRHERGNPARLFDTYRTRVANDESQTVIAAGATRYCRAQGRLLTGAGAFTDDELETFLRHALAAYGTSYPGCSVRTAASPVVP